MDELARDPRFMLNTSSGKAVYILGSFFNHSCDPSVDVVWPHNDGRVAFVTKRLITAGEQLFVSYIDESSPEASRRALLLDGWGINCQCAKCVEDRV